MSKTIPVGKTPKIEIDNIHKDLSLVGWEGEEILMNAEEAFKILAAREGAWHG
jgi:hypothetical protein